MTVGALGREEVRARLTSSGLRLQVGPFLVHLRSSIPAIHECISALYGEHEVAPGGHGAHFTVRVDSPGMLRRVFRPQVQFEFDGRRPFIPLPRHMAAPMLEAGLNWCVGSFANQFLVIHAATLDRGGRAILLPAPPGSGKSTLCAALVARGWRLLSDEFALVHPQTGALTPVPRPVSLKDGSIPVIRRWAPEAVFGPSTTNNEGQTVAYMRPPADSVRASTQSSLPAWLVIPQYAAGVETIATPMSRARALLHLADSSFNYNLHGKGGFERLAAIADMAPCVTLQYSDLASGVEAVERLTGAR